MKKLTPANISIDSIKEKDVADIFTTIFHKIEVLKEMDSRLDGCLISIVKKDIEKGEIVLYIDYFDDILEMCHETPSIPISYLFLDDVSLKTAYANYLSKEVEREAERKRQRELEKEKAIEHYERKLLEQLKEKYER